MKVQHFFDPHTFTLTYVVHDQTSRIGVVIDSVLDFDPKNGRTSYESCDAVARYIDAQRLTIPYVLDTHAHADHLSGMAYFKEKHGSLTVIGSHITQVQSRFRDLYNLGRDFLVDGRQFDILLRDEDVLKVGALSVKALHTPGHTPGSQCFLVQDRLVSGDTLFIGSCGRIDLPGSNPEQMYDSLVNKLMKLDDKTVVLPGHNYAAGRTSTTIGEERKQNPYIQFRSVSEFLRAMGYV